MTVKFNKVRVEEGNRAMDVFIPDMGDASETHDLTQASIEKTRDELKHNQKEISKCNPKDRQEALREYQERRDRKKEGTGNRKYF